MYNKALYFKVSVDNDFLFNFQALKTELFSLGIAFTNYFSISLSKLLFIVFNLKIENWIRLFSCVFFK